MNDSSHRTTAATGENPLPLEQIRAAITGIRFGSVEIVIHDGKVVQIERKEKVRFNAGQTRP